MCGSAPSLKRTDQEILNPDCRQQAGLLIYRAFEAGGRCLASLPGFC